MSGLVDTGAGLNLVNIEYHQSVAGRHTNLVLTFAYLKDLEDVDPLNISVVDCGKEGEQGKGGVYIYRINYLQKYLRGKQKTGDSLPRSWRMGGMQHHIFMAIHADN